MVFWDKNVVWKLGSNILENLPDIIFQVKDKNGVVTNRTTVSTVTLLET
jgi:hypothetical protein